MTYRKQNIRYNPKTARLLLARSRLRLPYTDSCTYFEADLYITKKGFYFLNGHGGCLSIFESEQDKIIPLGRERAEIICKEFMTKKSYEEWFQSSGNTGQAKAGRTAKARPHKNSSTAAPYLF